MKKYWNVDTEKLLTEDEIRQDYISLKATGDINPDIYDTFEYYLNSCLLDNNGSLIPVADDWMINRLQRDVASDIACDEMEYGKCLEVIQKYNMFSNWTTYEINNRPVDIDSIRETIEQELGLWR